MDMTPTFSLQSSQRPDDQTNWENLANAIVLQAVEDWKAAKTTQRSYIEWFFRSEWFGVLTKLDPELLIRRLQAEEQERLRRRQLRHAKEDMARVLAEAEATAAKFGGAV